MSGDEDTSGRPTWASNSGWAGPQNPSSNGAGGGKKSYRRSAELETENPPVESAENESQTAEPEIRSQEELIPDGTAANPPLEPQEVAVAESKEQIWKRTLMEAGNSRLEELTDRLVGLGGEIQGERAYVTRIAEGVMAHVTVSVKLRKG